LPAASISAEGSPSPLRSPPATVLLETLATGTREFQEAPPLVEVNERIAVPLVEKGTTTVPPGWTTGCPPSPEGTSAGEEGLDQVAPPLST
jgi:hypothetical protein